jgi:hypothetical protein
MMVQKVKNHILLVWVNSDSILLALHLLARYNFVHRDISTGNLLWDEKKCRGQLGDLEYVKLQNEEGKGGVKTVSGHLVM